MKSLLIIILFSLSLKTASADSFLLISSPESYVDKETFMASGEVIKIIQRQVSTTSQITILDTLRPERRWSFMIGPKEAAVTPGVHKIVRSFHQEKYFSNDTNATLEISFSTDGRGHNRYLGIARVHEADYSLGKALRRLSIDILLFGEGVRENWNYLEIRQNSNFPHTVRLSTPEKLPSLEELEKLFLEK